jgi:hypothetical protein
MKQVRLSSFTHFEHVQSTTHLVTAWQWVLSCSRRGTLQGMAVNVEVKMRELFSWVLPQVGTHVND